MLALLKSDCDAALSRDPAARSRLEVAVTYPGVHAIWAYRISHALWLRNAKFAARLLSSIARVLTGVDIHPAATLAPGVFIDHATGVVIGETAEVGENVTIYQGVTLGGTSLSRGKRHPTIGAGTIIGAGAKVLGPISIGANSRIGANAVVLKSVPEGSVVVGVPGRITTRNRARLPDNVTLDQEMMGLHLESLRERVQHLEGHVGHDHAHSRENEDFSI
ncbi:MAG: serine O-acetyltransferase [Acidimicrobiales bacterium]